MPYALKLAGFYGGIFLIFLVAYCSDYTLRLLITLSRKTKSKYYEDLMTTQFGHKGYLFVVGAMGIFAYGAMVAYLMGIGASSGRERVAAVRSGSLAIGSAARAPLP
jgi:amino acid permease